MGYLLLPQLRLTDNKRLIYKTSCKECKAFLRYDPETRDAQEDTFTEMYWPLGVYMSSQYAGVLVVVLLLNAAKCRELRARRSHEKAVDC